MASGRQFGPGRPAPAAPIQALLRAPPLVRPLCSSGPHSRGRPQPFGPPVPVPGLRDAVQNLTGAQLNRFIAIRRQQGVSAATINGALRILKAVLRHALCEKRIPELPVKITLLAAPRKKAVNLVSADEFHWVNEAAEPRVRALLAICARRACASRRRCTCSGPTSTSPAVASAYERGRRTHAIRHSVASEMLGNGIDIETVRQILGHSSVLVPQGYLHSNDQRKRAAARTGSLLRPRKRRR